MEFSMDFSIDFEPCVEHAKEKHRIVMRSKKNPWVYSLTEELYTSEIDAWIDAARIFNALHARCLNHLKQLIEP